MTQGTPFHIITLHDGDTVMCVFAPNGEAFLRFAGLCIQVEGTFEPGDTKAVKDAYAEHNATVDEEVIRFLEENDEETELPMAAEMVMPDPAEIHSKYGITDHEISD